MLASIDGSISAVAEARIPVTDEGLLRGDGAFEVLRLYGGRPFALEDHLARLQRSAGGLHLSVDMAALRVEVDALLSARDPGDCLLRLVATRGGRRIAILEPLPPRPETAAVKTVTYAPNRILDNLKTLSYAANMLATRVAKEEGFDEAVFVTPHGRVLEGTTWTLFWVQDGELCTTPLEERILDSITRRRVLESSPVSERVITADELDTVEEAFIASTVREVMPISRIGNTVLPAAPGPVTAAAARALRARIAEELGAAV